MVVEPKVAQNVLSFGAFEADLTTGELRKNGIFVHLQEQPFQVLKVLLEHPRELISREQLRAAVWPQNTFVDFDHALNTAVKKIRHALDDDALSPKFVQTIPRRGYRFIAEVQPRALNTSPGLARRSLDAKNRWAVAAILVLSSVAIFAGLGKSAKDHHPSANRVSVVVLPVENLSGSAEFNRLADDLTEEAISRLSALNPEQFGITARTTAVQYRNSQKTAAEIGRELQVDYIVEGCLRADGDHIRVTGRIVRTNDQSYIWTHSFDLRETDQSTLDTFGTAIVEQIQKSMPQN